MRIGRMDIDTQIHVVKNLLSFLTKEKENDEEVEMVETKVDGKFEDYFDSSKPVDASDVVRSTSSKKKHKKSGKQGVSVDNLKPKSTIFD